MIFNARKITMSSVSDNVSHFHPDFLFSIKVLCIIFMGIALCGVAGADTWQQTPSPDWVQVEIPSGWTISKDLAMGDDNQPASFSACSPDRDAELVYILDHTKSDTTLDTIQIYQDQWMQGRGFRICKTKEPVKRTKSDHSSIKQVYVQGSNQGAVMYSASYPEWGQYHVALLMTGESAVQQYYDSLPPQIEDHVIPVIQEDEIGKITFTPGTKTSE